jgi:CheY-like chemotaxis protein
LGSEYTIHNATNGVTAIKMAKKHKPDLILLDIIMPEMDGYQTLAEIKKSEELQNIPVIFISGLNSVEDEEKGLNMDAADFIYKPFSAKIVKLRVRNQIQIINQIRELTGLHQNLKTAVKSAESANRFKSVFLDSMNHEMRTSLNAVLGISEIQLYNKDIPQDIRESFARIFYSGDLLLSIINDILAMSKIDAGKLELIEDSYDVAALINNTVLLNVIKFENKPIEFIVNVDENVPSQLYGDELRIKQVLNSLLSNAFKYTNAGEVELSVSMENQPGKPGDIVRLVFRVRDTGQGMSKEQIDKLFSEHSVSNSETGEDAEDTGLGLTILKDLICMMKGEIHAESKAGGGSLFTVRLQQGNVGSQPLGKEAADNLRQFRTNYEAKTKRPEIVRGPTYCGRVLVVDDVDINLYVAEAMLSYYGLQVDTAVNGSEAIEKVKANEYNIVFMDHMMPKMDGIETTREIRKLGSKYEKLPIIALTANAVHGIKEMYLNNGFNGFIPKPVGMKELDEVIKEWIKI